MTLHEQILVLIKSQPLRSMDVREHFMKLGFCQADIRNAIAEMWDDGRINIDLKQILKANV